MARKTKFDFTSYPESHFLSGEVFDAFCEEVCTTLAGQPNVQIAKEVATSNRPVFICGIAEPPSNHSTRFIKISYLGSSKVDETLRDIAAKFPKAESRSLSPGMQRLLGRP